jgi:hypothetical protein
LSPSQRRERRDEIVGVASRFVEVIFDSRPRPRRSNAASLQRDRQECTVISAQSGLRNERATRSNSLLDFEGNDVTRQAKILGIESKLKAFELGTCTAGH